MNPVHLGRLPLPYEWRPTLLSDKFHLASLLRESQPDRDKSSDWFRPRALAQPDPSGEDFMERRYATLPGLDDLALGEVSPVGQMLPESELCRSLATMAEENGFFPRERGLYCSRDVIAVRGSVDYHVDDGLGCCLSLLAWADPLVNGGIAFERGVAHLAGPSKSVCVEIGDVFVFNGSRPHAWISNCNCVLAQLTVGKRRKKTTTAS